MKNTIGNVCFLIDETKEEILLLERYNEPMSNLFTGVGGKTNQQEDIHNSCIREIEEETGLVASECQLKAVIKTILKGSESSWILFVYTSKKFDGKMIECDEGKLVWISIKNLFNKNLIGFIREILPSVIQEGNFTEGTIIHDINGQVLQKIIHTY